MISKSYHIEHFLSRPPAPHNKKHPFSGENSPENRVFLRVQVSALVLGCSLQTLHGTLQCDLALIIFMHALLVLQALFRTDAGRLGTVLVDILRALGAVHQHHHIRGGHLGNAVAHQHIPGFAIHYKVEDTVQVIPHITNEIKDRIFRASKLDSPDVVITEIGGTVGDIESTPFMEAIRQVSREIGKENCLYIHVTLIPYLSKGGEMKTKPTQHSVKELLSIGIQPDVIVCRTEHEISAEMKQKLSLFCNVENDCIIQNMDADSLYEIPVMLEKEGLAKVACRKLGLADTKPVLTDWLEMLDKERSMSGEVEIALVGKYVELHDAYLSVVESLHHAGIHNGVKL